MQPETQPESPAALGGKVARGATFLIGANIGVRLISLAGVAILARLLTPQDYGILALAIVVHGTILVMTELQVASALIRLPAIAPHLYATAFAVTILRGTLLAAVLVAVSELAAQLMDEPALAAVLKVLAIGAFVEGLRNPRLVDFDRAVNFAPEALMTVAARLIGTVLSILIALVWRDYWALIIGTVATSAATTLIGHALRPWRPAVSLRDWQIFIAFGGWISLASVTNFVTSRVDFVFLKQVLGTAIVGQYNMGYFVATMVTNSLANHFSRSIYPALSQLAAEPARLRAAYLKSQASIIGLLLPAGVGLALTARELILIVAGPQWDDAALILQVVAPGMALMMMVSATNALMMVKGCTRNLFLRDLVHLALYVPLVAVGVWRFGLPGALAANFTGNLLYVLLTLTMVRWITGWPWFGPVIACARSLGACAAMAAVVLAAAWALPEAGDNYTTAAALLAAKAALGALVYAAAHYTLWRRAGRPDGFERVMLSALTGLARRLGGRRFLAG